MFESFQNKNILVKESLLHGKGLFSNSVLFKGQKISNIIGELIDEGECIRRENDGNVYIFWKDDNTYIDVSHTNDLKFINHSCDYNCIVDEDEEGNLVLLAAREIKMGEELTIDYGYEEIYETCSCSECINKTEDQ